MSHSKLKTSSSKEVHPSGPLDMRDAFYTNLLLLGFDQAEMEGKFNMPFSKDMFALPNKKGFEVVMHFLFTKLNPAMVQEKFRYCWPISDKKQEQAFRKVVNSWLTEIKEEEECFLPRIVPSIFLSPGGDKFYTLLLHFSRFVMNKVILGGNGGKERELLLHPQLSVKDPELAALVGRALQACCVKHSRSFLTHLQEDLLLQERWSSYASELVAEYRRLTKEIREIEQQIRQEEALLMEQANARGSPSVTRRRRSGALLDAEWKTMAVRRTQRVQKVREMWKSVGECHAGQREEREVIDSILEGAANRYRVDGADLHVQVPEVLLRECHREIEKQNVGNTYQGGKLNLLSLIQLWNLSLRLYLEKLHQSPIADYDSLHPGVVAQVHSHHAHLTNLQALRSSMSQDILPSIKSSIKSLKKQLELGYEAPTSDYSTRTPASNFLGQGLGLLPSTPPVSFEPAQTSSDTPTGPMTQALKKTSPTVDTPEAVSSLLKTVNQAVKQQSSLAQGTPTSTLKLLRDQINRPSKLPRALHPTEADQRKPDRRRIKSAPAKASSSSRKDHYQSREDTLEVEEVKPYVANENEFSLSSRRDKGLAKTQPRKVTKESRIRSWRGPQNTSRPTPGQSVRKSNRKISQSGKKPTASSMVGNGALHTRPRDDPATSGVERAHQVLIDQIADAVLGGMTVSPEFKDSGRSLPSTSPGVPDSFVPMGIKDPLSALDQSAFITRDKLQHSPVSSTARYPINQSPPSATKVDPRMQETNSLADGQKVKLVENNSNIRVDCDVTNDAGGEQILDGMESEDGKEDEAPVGSLLNLSLSSPVYQTIHDETPQSRLQAVKQNSFSTQSPEDQKSLGEMHLELLHIANTNNSRQNNPSGFSPFKLDIESFTSSPLVSPDSPTGGGGSSTSAKSTTPLGLVEMDQQLSEIFGTRTPQLPGRLYGRVGSLSPALSGEDSTGTGSSSPNVDDAKERLDFDSSPTLAENPDVLIVDALNADITAVNHSEIEAESPVDDRVGPMGIMSSQRVATSSKKRGSSGSQKSVTFSDHVDQHNISSHSDLNASASDADVFFTGGTFQTPTVNSQTETDEGVGESVLNGQTGFARDAAVLHDAYLSPLSESILYNGKVVEASPFGEQFNLDDSSENGHDFLLDTSSRIEDLLVHVSPTVTPSVTPKLQGSRVMGSRLSHTSIGSAPNSISKKALPATNDTPNLAPEFDLLDEDESILLPPSPYAQSPLTQSPSVALGHLIDI